MAVQLNEQSYDDLFGSNTLSIEALFGEGIMEPTDEGQQIVAQADLIMGRDIDSGHHFLIYGTEVLDCVLQTGDLASIHPLRIDLDQEGDDLERILTYVTIVKGAHDYPAQDRTPVVCSDYAGPMIWHYTLVPTLMGGILEEGLLRLSKAYSPSDERPAVWFSSNPMWEATANRCGTDVITGQQVALTWDQMKQVGPVRIGVRPEDAPIKWSVHKRSGGINPKLAKRLESLGLGEPHQWFCSYVEVPRAKWVAIELCNQRNGRWEPLTVERLRQLETLKAVQQDDK